MNEAARKARNVAIAGELYPWMRERFWATLHDLEALGERPRGQVGWRSIQQQAIEVAEHDSAVLFGYHNVTGRNGEKESFAADVLDDDDPLDAEPSIPHSVYALKLAACAEANGLRTLIRWGLEPAQRAAIDSAILNRDWLAPVRLGKDPDHIQPAEPWIEKLRTGWRPPLETLVPAGPAGHADLGATPPASVGGLSQPLPGPTLSERVAATRGLPAIGQTRGPDGTFTQLDGNVRELVQKLGAGGAFEDLPISVQMTIRRQFPQYLFWAVRQLVAEEGMEAGVMDFGLAWGHATRAHGDPVQLVAAELRRFLIDWGVTAQ